MARSRCEMRRLDLKSRIVDDVRPTRKSLHILTIWRGARVREDDVLVRQSCGMPCAVANGAKASEATTPAIRAERVRTARKPSDLQEKAEGSRKPNMLFIGGGVRDVLMSNQYEFSKLGVYNLRFESNAASEVCTAAMRHFSRGRTLCEIRKNIL